MIFANVLHGLYPIAWVRNCRSLAVATFSLTLLCQIASYAICKKTHAQTPGSLGNSGQGTYLIAWVCNAGQYNCSQLANTSLPDCRTLAIDKKPHAHAQIVTHA